MTDAIVAAMVDSIKQDMQEFAEQRDLSTLTPQVAADLERALGDALARAGQAGFRTFLESYDTKQDVVHDARGEAFRFKADRPRKSVTLFGVVQVSRACYQNKSDTKSYAPLDAAWGMEGRYATPHVREAMLYASALVTPVEAMGLFRKCALFHPHSTNIKREVKETGALMEHRNEELMHDVRAAESVPADTHALVLSADGATVLMNEQGVRFGRPRQRPGGQEPQERSTAYRVAMVGALSYYGLCKEPGKGSPRLQSRYLGQMPEEGWPTFKKRLEAEVDDAEAQLAPDVARILLLDGSRQLWNYFDKNPRYDGYRRCIDYWHAIEHLSVAAEALFGPGEHAKAWYHKYRRVLRTHTDGAHRILRSIDYYAPKHKRTKTSQKHLREERTYFHRNKRLMNYAAFCANGLPIGSGPIEAACKTLIKTRLCRSGMRWSRKGGQHILNLRVAVKSGRWDQTWQQIRQMETAA